MEAGGFTIFVHSCTRWANYNEWCYCVTVSIHINWIALLCDGSVSWRAHLLFFSESRCAESDVLQLPTPVLLALSSSDGARRGRHVVSAFLLLIKPVLGISIEY